MVKMSVSDWRRASSVVTFGMGLGLKKTKHRLEDQHFFIGNRYKNSIKMSFS